jgi:hypothetical protein
MKKPSDIIILKLVAGIKAAAGLMDNSSWVYGLHLNGDEAPWDELRTGGYMEEWLVEFDEALSIAELLSSEGEP